MKKVILPVFLGFAILILLAAGSMVSSPGSEGNTLFGTVEDNEIVRAEYIELSPEEAKEMIDNEDVIILDVRTEEEFRQGHIEGAILIPDYDLDKLVEDMIPDREATILIYCRSGNRSKLSAHLLIGMGYQNVYDFGGIIDWRYGEVQGEPAN